MRLAQHIEALPTSYIREILAATNTSDVISLAGGLPAAEHFPLTLVETAIDSLKHDPLAFQYGSTQGYCALVTLLKQRQSTLSEHELLVTNGAQQGIDLIARAFIDPGDKVLMEAPSYLGAIQAFALARAQLDNIEQDAQGPQLDQLERLFQQHQYKIFYCTPDFQNPSGLCWSLETRKEVARMCREYGVLLLEDCPYRELRFSGKELPKVSDFCPENAIVLSSFSKITMPGMRLGSIHGPKKWLSHIEKIKQAVDLHTNTPMQYVLLALLQHKDFPAHLVSLRQTYQARCQTLEQLLLNHAGDYGIFNPVEGGMFLWFQLHKHDATQVAQATLKQGLAVVPSPSFYSNEDHAPSALRLNFSHSNQKTLTGGVKILAKILREL